jgi:hypothetical protein
VRHLVHLTRQMRLVACYLLEVLLAWSIRWKSGALGVISAGKGKEKGTDLLDANLWFGCSARRAGEGNRTPIASLEGWSSTIELHPRV